MPEKEIGKLLEKEKEKSELLYEIVKLIMYIEFGFFVGLFIQTY